MEGFKLGKQDLIKISLFLFPASRSRNFRKSKVSISNDSSRNSNSYFPLTTGLISSSGVSIETIKLVQEQWIEELFFYRYLRFLIDRSFQMWYEFWFTSILNFIFLRNNRLDILPQSLNQIIHTFSNEFDLEVNLCSLDKNSDSWQIPNWAICLESPQGTNFFPCDYEPIFFHEGLNWPNFSGKRVLIFKRMDFIPQKLIALSKVCS